MTSHSGGLVRHAGLVTLATAFALPADFPQRDSVVLAAFAVVLATLVVQGLTLAPMVRLLGLDRRSQGADELSVLRAQIASAGLSSLDQHKGLEAELLKAKVRIELEALSHPAGAAVLENYRAMALVSTAAQRMALEELRRTSQLNADEYNLLLEEIDWRELSVLPDKDRRIEEI